MIASRKPLGAPTPLPPSPGLRVEPEYNVQPSVSALSKWDVGGGVVAVGVGVVGVSVRIRSGEVVLVGRAGAGVSVGTGVKEGDGAIEVFVGTKIVAVITGTAVGVCCGGTSDGIKYKPIPRT